MLSLSGFSQFSVSIRLAGWPAFKEGDTLFIAGNFNNWNPQHPSFRFRKDSAGNYSVRLNHIRAGTLAFKITRGGWERRETDEKGMDIPNREAHITADTTITVSVEGWQDAFDPRQPPHTASPRVQVLDAAFPMPQLGRKRRIWLYLPQGYSQSDRHYPVLYMQDGQNLFDNATSFAGEWGIDEFLDKQAPSLIVVGIDNGAALRMNEYNPNDSKPYGKGEGRAYLDFIVSNLKPYIDQHYRTLPGQSTTAMAGSSMGGLISFYAGLYYPGVFGRLGIFSPSFWLVPSLGVQLKKLVDPRASSSQHYYFYGGESEDARLSKDMKAIAAKLEKLAGCEVKVVTDPSGKHNEASWSRAFPGFFGWLQLPQ